MVFGLAVLGLQQSAALMLRKGRLTGKSVVAADQGPHLEKGRHVEEEEPVIEFLARPAVLGVFVFVLSIVLYANSLGHEFTFDDNAAVVRNPVVTGDVPIVETLRRDFWGTYGSGLCRMDADAPSFRHPHILHLVSQELSTSDVVTAALAGRQTCDVTRLFSLTPASSFCSGGLALATLLFSMEP